MGDVEKEKIKITKIRTGNEWKKERENRKKEQMKQRKKESR